MRLNIKEITRVLFILLVSGTVTFLISGLSPAFFSGSVVEFENGITFSDDEVDSIDIIRVGGEVLLSNGQFLSRLNDDNIAYIEEKFVGIIMPFGGLETKVPTGWLLCDGSFVPTASYPALYAKIGDTWGAPENIFVFKLPDLTSFYLRGATSSDALASTSDYTTHFGPDVAVILNDTGSQHTHDSWDSVNAEFSAAFGPDIANQKQTIIVDPPVRGSNEGTGDHIHNEAQSAGDKTTSSTTMTHNHDNADIPSANFKAAFDIETRPDSIGVQHYIFAGSTR